MLSGLSLFRALFCSGTHGRLVEVEGGPYLVGHPVADAPAGQELIKFGPLGGDDLQAEVTLGLAGLGGDLGVGLITQAVT